MDDKTRARNYYAAAVILFQDPSEDDCERIIELLEKAFNLYSDLDTLVFIGEVWHYLLKSLDEYNNSETYKKYLSSPAWNRKRDLVIERDKGRCVRCCAEGRVVHHKTYDNIGKEPLSDLVLLCEKCHEGEHQSGVPSDQQSSTQQGPHESSDHQAATQQPSELLPKEVFVQDAFIAYIARESDILRLDDFGSSDYIGYESGYEKENGYRQIWIAAWIPDDRKEIAAVISVGSNSRYFESHYKKFEEHKDRIENTFSFEDVKFAEASSGIWQLRVMKEDVDLTQKTDRDAAFRWLRENLEKLYWVLRVHDTLRWDTVSSAD